MSDIQPADAALLTMLAAGPFYPDHAAQLLRDHGPRLRALADVLEKAGR